MCWMSVALVPRPTGISVKIECPFCGPRPLVEFSYAGSADVARPASDAPLADWNAFVHMRDNLYGVSREYWHHSGGCRSVLIVARDTRTHAISSVQMAGAGA